MKRFRWIILGIVIILVIVVAGVSYAAHFASTVNTPHATPGVAKACTTSAPINGLQTFQIVPVPHSI